MSAAHATPPEDRHVQRLSLTRQLETVLEECRIVLPGIQALFGFQLAVVFSERFDRILTQRSRRCTCWPWPSWRWPSR